MLAGRDVPRLVVEALNDPANGDFELRSYADLDAWQKTIGPDARLPSMRRTLRESFADIRQGEQGGWHDQVIVPPITARRIANIFADLGKTQISFAQVQIGDRPSQILEVGVTGEDPVPVMIPATSCWSGLDHR